MGTVIFVLLVNAVLFALLYLIKLLTGGMFGANYLSDYFFYSLIIQWLVATFLRVSAPNGVSSISRLRHSPLPYTRKAASLVDEAQGNEMRATSLLASDMSLSNRLFLSGGFSLIMCFIL